MPDPNFVPYCSSCGSDSTYLVICPYLGEWMVECHECWYQEYKEAINEAPMNPAIG